MRVVLIILALVIVVLAGGVVLVGPNLNGSSISILRSEAKGTPVRVQQANVTTLIETVQAPGEIEPHTEVQVSAEVSAKIEQLPFDEGSDIRRGDLVAKLDDRDLQARLVSTTARRDGEKYRLQSDQARLSGLKMRLEFAKSEFERMQSLHESGDVSKRDFETALESLEDLGSSVESTTFSIAVVEASLAAAEADIERAEDAITKTSLLAAMDGIMTQLNVEVGEVVTGSLNNPGTVLMTIADLSRMVHIAEVAESDIARVDVGQRAKLHINGYPDEKFTGTVRQIALQRSGSADGTGHFRTEIEIDLQGRQIRSGHIANAEIEIETHEGIVVPYQAIVAREVEELPESVRDSPWVDPERKYANVVYRLIDGKAVCTPVDAGASDLTHRLVLHGLESDDIVVVGPYKTLETIRHDESAHDQDANPVEAETTEPEAEAAESDTPEDAPEQAAPSGDGS